jgi:hypothetical protein
MKAEVRGQNSENRSLRSEITRGPRRLNSAKDLDVYKKAYELAMTIFRLSKTFPDEERFGLTGQIETLVTLRLLESPRGVGKETI